MGSDQDLVDRDLTEEGEEIEPSFFASPKRMLQTAVVVLVLVGAIYILLPRLVGIQDAMGQLGNAAPGWLGVALVFCVLMFFSYVALFRGVVGERVVHLEWSESYQITMAGLAATRLFSAGGAGGIVLTYWALRKAGMERRQTACRMVAFLVLLYAVYMLALVVFGVLLRVGVLSGQSPAGLTIVPAAVAGALLLLCLLVALIPDDVERRLAGFARGYRFHRFAKRLASAPATLASGTRTAISFARNPSRGGLAVIGAVGFWACNIGILWAAFHAYDVHVPLGVVVQGFFVGMVANLFPLAPGGVGAVDAGMIGTFVLFGLPSSEVFAAVLTYRLAAFWLPIPPGIVAFFQLRRTVSRWDEERARAPVGAGIGDPLRGTAITSESKV
jgi:putative heme transporter